MVRPFNLLREAIEVGDPINDGELAYALFRYETAIAAMKDMGPDFRLTMKSLRETSDRLEGYAISRGLYEIKEGFRKLYATERMQVEICLRDVPG